MPTTSGTPWNIPTPLLPEAPDAPANLLDMAGSIHAALGRAYPCLSSARPGHVEGLLIYETDTELLQVSDGTNWWPLFWASSSKPRAIMSRTSVQTLTSGSLTIITYTTGLTAPDFYAVGVTADPTSGLFTITRAGYYKLRACIPFAAVNTTGYRAAVIRVNPSAAGLILASDYRPSGPSQITTCNPETVAPTLLAVGDTIGVQAIHTAGVSNDVTNGNGNLEFGIEWWGP